MPQFNSYKLKKKEKKNKDIGLEYQLQSENLIGCT